MTELRDKIAIAAMNALIQRGNYTAESQVATYAYTFADAMIRVRNETRARPKPEPSKIIGNPSGTVVGDYG